MHKTNSGNSLNRQQLYKKYRNVYHRLIRKVKVKHYGTLLYEFKVIYQRHGECSNRLLKKNSDKSGVSDCFSVNNTKVTNQKYILTKAFIPILQIWDVILHLKFSIQRNHIPLI